MKKWFSIKENKDKFKESLKKIPLELKKKWSSKGGKAFSYKFKNDINFRKNVLKKLSNSLKGHIVSEETRKKISKSVTGYRHTEETKKIIRKKRSMQKNVSPGYIGTKVNYFSKKFNKFFKLKSKYEYRFIKVCEENRDIIDIEYEPFSIEYKNNHHYKPDFKIKKRNNDIIIIEIKGDYLYKKFKNKYDIIFNYMLKNYNFKVFFTKELEDFEKGVIDV
jgi:hypothetical protein